MKSFRHAIEKILSVTKITGSTDPTFSARFWSDKLDLKPFSLSDFATDDDLDGLPDRWETILAERFAPIFYYEKDEPNYPTNVDWFLERTALYFYDDSAGDAQHKFLLRPPTQVQLINQRPETDADTGRLIHPDGTRSDSKSCTFYLQDVAEEFRRGSLDSKDWVTYYHTYPNDKGGVTIQYWHFHSFNDGTWNNHGGDWEGIHVVLAPTLQPHEIFIIGHHGSDAIPAAECRWEGTHVKIYNESGGHVGDKEGDEKGSIRQDTWTGGHVLWTDGHVSQTGPLVNLGSKIAPLNGQVFIQYSGIWGSPGVFYFTSGYWGPAFNEVSMDEKTGFIPSWGRGMVDNPDIPDMIHRECHPTSRSR